ncbi:MAG: hypothetical protein Q7S48_02445 [bacterium]|nr:hypothetical protein [bacterium]
MSERLKRILQIGGFILIVFAIGFAIWWVFFRSSVIVSRPPTVTPPITQPPSTGGGLTPSGAATPGFEIPAPVQTGEATPSMIAKGGITATAAIGNAPVLSPFLSGDGTTLQYYNRLDGKFYRIRSDGTAEALSDKVFFNVSSVQWAPDRNQAILEYPDGSNILYNFATKTQATLPKHWEKFDFSPRSDQIAFLSSGDDQDSRWLAVAKPDGSGSKPIEALGNNASKVQVAWSPNDQIIAFSKTGGPQGFGEQEIFMVGRQGENFRSLLVSGVGFAGQWSPDGRILYSTSDADNDWKPQLWIVDGSPDRMGANKTSLGLTTWADKCSFGGTTTIYCAVPETLPRGVGLYPAAAGNSPDRIWRVDLASGVREQVAIPSESHTIDSIVVSEDGRQLYFTDKISGQLYRITLK